MSFRRLLSLVALLAVLEPDAARAQGEPVRQALELGYEGDRLYAQSRWADAYEKFAAADSRAHSPVFTLYMARCRKNAGRLIEAKAIYERVVRESPPSNAPKPFREAIADARAELAEVERRTPSVRVRVKGASSGTPTVSIDGKVVPKPEAATPLDPGAHTIEAASGSLRANEVVTLTEGAEPKTVEIDLTGAGGAGATPPTGNAGAVSPRPTPAPDEPGSTAPAWVALSIGVVGLGVGAVTGLLAASKADAIKEGCVDNHCLREDEGELDSARTLALFSTIGFIAGGVGVAAAGVLFVVRPGGGPSKATGAVADPWWIGVRGAF